MKSVAETIIIRDDESIEIENKMIELEKEADEEADDTVLSAGSDMPENRFGNVWVSLFWEEKIILMLRYCQFYGFLLLCFYETWPDKY